MKLKNIHHNYLRWKTNCKSIVLCCSPNLHWFSFFLHTNPDLLFVCISQLVFRERWEMKGVGLCLVWRWSPSFLFVRGHSTAAHGLVCFEYQTDFFCASACPSLTHKMFIYTTLWVIPAEPETNLCHQPMVSFNHVITWLPTTRQNTANFYLKSK